MSWDIYGHPLKHGYCEVHPGVAEPYPCYYCLSETAAPECCASGQCEVCCPVHPDTYTEWEEVTDE